MTSSHQIISIWELDSQHSESVDSSRVQQLISLSNDFLKQQFEDGIDVEILLKQRTLFIDELLTQYWQQHFDNDFPATLLAVGGYGRSELHPHSDIDLLIILDETIAETPPESLSAFITEMWDMNLNIGYSVRTIAQCQTEAVDDVSIASNLLEARYLVGQQSYYDSLQSLIHNSENWDIKRFFELKRQEQQERHKKYKGTINNLEPNIKESPGGLRDIQIIVWVARKYFDVNSIEGLHKKGFIAESEYVNLSKARHFLWKIRFLLHLLADRPQDKLLIDYQRKIATVLGYKDNDSKMAVEQFMKEYYLCARTVRQMNSLLLQLFEEEFILANEPSDIRIINHRFQSHNSYLETINSGIFAHVPNTILEVFLLLIHHPEIKGIRASTMRQINAHIHLIDNKFRADPRNKALFMEIIRHLTTSHVFQLFKMNQLGVLGAYLPEFGKIVGQMQHDLFHAYTVDEHTLFLVGNLYRMGRKEYRERYPFCSEVFKRIQKPEILFTAGLYHDIAKGRGGDHSILGMVDARAFCNNHRFNSEDTEIVVFLVRYHLSMSSVAQKSDLDDPEVIKSFAELVETKERLDYLFLLTVADIQATNSELWNSWRDTLLKQLYRGTEQWLESEEEQIQSTREKSQYHYQQALEQLTKSGYSSQIVSSLWQSYELDYFLRHSVNSIVWQTRQRLTQQDKLPLIALRSHKEANTLEIFTFSDNKKGTFAAITAALELSQLNVLDAKVNLTNQDKALCTFMVEGHISMMDEIAIAIEENLNNLNIQQTFNSTLTPRKMKLFITEPQIEITTNHKQAHTILSLNTHDRPGLVSAISQAFLACDINLINAKINTIGDQVEDVFFITSDKKPLSENQQSKLKSTLIEHLE